MARALLASMLVEAQTLCAVPEPARLPVNLQERKMLRQLDHLQQSAQEIAEDLRELNRQHALLLEKIQNSSSPREMAAALGEVKQLQQELELAHTALDEVGEQMRLLAPAMEKAGLLPEGAGKCLDALTDLASAPRGSLDALTLKGAGADSEEGMLESPAMARARIQEQVRLTEAAFAATVEGANSISSGGIEKGVVLARTQSLFSGFKGAAERFAADAGAAVSGGPEASQGQGGAELQERFAAGVKAMQQRIDDGALVVHGIASEKKNTFGMRN